MEVEIILIKSIQNQHVQKWKKYKLSKYRQEKQKFLVEGVHLVEEALHANCVVEIILGPDVSIPKHWHLVNIPLFHVDTKIVRELTDLTNPQPIFAVCTILPWEDNLQLAEQILLVDAVQDPGNLGTLIRTADAVGIELIVIGTGSVNVWNAKVIRATQGSIFHVPIVTGALLPIIKQLKARKIPVFSSVLTNTAVSVFELTKTASFALIVGNEGSGINLELREASTDLIYVPIYGRAESLNVAVATGVMLYQLQVNSS